mmetsp:Transcript_3529/g.15754  ORF Transcript_3529/g.15754 Transcript_3529/m.15754 type:complete len:290 (-) Transcript_3529:4807-5676(-)
MEDSEPESDPPASLSKADLGSLGGGCGRLNDPPRERSAESPLRMVCTRAGSPAFSSRRDSSARLTSTISTTGPGPGATLLRDGAFASPTPLRLLTAPTAPSAPSAPSEDTMDERPRLDAAGDPYDAFSIVPPPPPPHPRQPPHPNLARHRSRCLSRTRRLCLATARSYFSHCSCSTMSSGRVRPTSTNPSVKPIAASSAARSMEWIRCPTASPSLTKSRGVRPLASLDSSTFGSESDLTISHRIAATFRARTSECMTLATVRTLSKPNASPASGVKLAPFSSNRNARYV